MKKDEIFLGAEVLYLPIVYVHNIVEDPCIRNQAVIFKVLFPPFLHSVSPDSNNVQCQGYCHVHHHKGNNPPDFQQKLPEMFWTEGEMGDGWNAEPHSETGPVQQLKNFHSFLCSLTSLVPCPTSDHIHGSIDIQTKLEKPIILTHSEAIKHADRFGEGFILLKFFNISCYGHLFFTCTSIQF